MTGQSEPTFALSALGRYVAALVGLSGTAAAGAVDLEPSVDWELGNRYTEAVVVGPGNSAAAPAPDIL